MRGQYSITEINFLLFVYQKKSLSIAFGSQRGHFDHYLQILNSRITKHGAGYLH